MLSRRAREKEKTGLGMHDMMPPAFQEEIDRLKRAVDELTVLNELASQIGASYDSEDIMKRIISRSLRAVRAEQAVINLVDRPRREAARTLVRTMVSSSEHGKFHLDQNLLGWMQINKKPLSLHDPQHDERFKGLKWDESISSLLCVPLMVKSDLIGVLTVYNKKVADRFTPEDERLLAIIASQSAQVIENARLYEEEKALLRMQEELRLAAEIQIDLLPKKPPLIRGYDIAGTSIPAQMVGGDYFDFIQVDDNLWTICLGDVSGKGMPASLLMANLQATLRGQTILGGSAKQCVKRSNKLLFHSTDPEKFATLFYGSLDNKKHLLTFSNAGHENPFFFSKQKALRLKTGGLVLGVMEDFPYEEETIPFNTGDILIVYSDGVVDAVNASEAQFGEEKLLEVVNEHRNDSASEIISKIVGEIRQHAGAAPQLDDITLVVARRA